MKNILEGKISPSQVKDLIGLEPATIRGWERAGLIINYAVGTRGENRRYDPDELRAAVAVQWNPDEKVLLRNAIQARKQRLIATKVLISPHESIAA